MPVFSLPPLEDQAVPGTALADGFGDVKREGIAPQSHRGSEVKKEPMRAAWHSPCPSFRRFLPRSQPAPSPSPPQPFVHGAVAASSQNLLTRGIGAIRSAAQALARAVDPVAEPADHRTAQRESCAGCPAVQAAGSLEIRRVLGF